MNLEWFRQQPKVLYTLGFLMLLIVIQQIAGWSIRETYELYYYENCTFFLNNRFNCEENYEKTIYQASQNIFPRLKSKCPSPTEKDCYTACKITSLYELSLIFPLITLCYIIIYYSLYYLLRCKIQGIRQMKQVLWILCYIICCQFQFSSSSDVNSFSPEVNPNSQVQAALIGMGTLSILIIIAIVLLNNQLHKYFERDFEDQILFKQQINICKDMSQKHNEKSLFKIILMQQQKIIQLLAQRIQQLKDRNTEMPQQQVQLQCQVILQKQNYQIGQAYQDQNGEQIGLLR